MAINKTELAIKARTFYKIGLLIKNVPFLFPVNPQEIKFYHPANISRYNVLGIGEVCIPRLPDLRSVEFESFFTNSVEHPYYQFGGMLPDPARVIIERAMKTKQVCFLLIIRFDLSSGIMLPTFMWCVIEDFTMTEKGGELGDYYFSIKLTEYRPINVLTAGLQNTLANNTPSSPANDVNARVISDSELTKGKVVSVKGQGFTAAENVNRVGKNWSGQQLEIDYFDNVYNKYRLKTVGTSADYQLWASKDQITIVG